MALDTAGLELFLICAHVFPAAVSVGPYQCYEIARLAANGQQFVLHCQGGMEERVGGRGPGKSSLALSLFLSFRSVFSSASYSRSPLFPSRLISL